MSAATAGHCWSAFLGLTTALRDAKLLPASQVAKKAPTAPSAPEGAPEPLFAEGA
jgi:hypothetical protein